MFGGPVSVFQTCKSINLYFRDADGDFLDFFRFFKTFSVFFRLFKAFSEFSDFSIPVTLKHCPWRVGKRSRSAGFLRKLVTTQLRTRCGALETVLSLNGSVVVENVP